MNQILQSLGALFGSLALVGLVIGGFVLMFSPSRGKKILTNTAIGAAIFVGASMLMGSLAGAAKDAVGQGSIGTALAAAALCVVGGVIVTAAFVYVFNPRVAGVLLKRAAVAVLAVLMFAFGAHAFFGYLNIISVLLLLGLASIVAFIIRERQRPRLTRRNSGTPERKPLLPRREDRA